MKTRGTISEAKAGQGKGRTEQGERVSTEADMESATGKRGFAVMEGDPAGDACLVGRPETKHEQGEHPPASLVLLHHISAKHELPTVYRHHARLHTSSIELSGWFSPERTG